MMLSDYLEEIDDKIAEYKVKYAEDPKAIILPVEYRQAIKIIGRLNFNGDLAEFFGIPVIPKEEVIILGELK